MKNTTIVLLLILGLISAQFSQYFVMAGFDLNQKYIAERLCINKSRPWMHCNGRCYLMKKLKQSADKEKATERENQKNSFQVAIISPVDQFAFPVQASKVFMMFEQQFALSKNYASIFQPPKA